MTAHTHFPPLKKIILFIYLFICVWLHLVFVAAHGLSLVAESQDHSRVAVHRLLTVVVSFWSTGSRWSGFSSCSLQGSVVVACGPSCSAACGILPDQGSNPCPVHRQAVCHPLYHQGSPFPSIFNLIPGLQTSKSKLMSHQHPGSI